jgi:RNA polymerase sigma-70 factor (ECF subfamily)
MLPTDETPVARSQEFEAMVSPHLSTLFALALQLTREASQAQDLVQETMLKAYRFLHRFEPGTNFRAWLATMMRHLYFSHRRKLAREVLTENVEYLAPVTAPGAAAELQIEHLSTLVTYLPHLVSDEVLRALQNVPETYRTAVLMADVLDYSYKEMADAMECPIGTLMSRLYRGRQKLQEQLQPYAVMQGYIRPTGPAGEAAPEQARAALTHSGRAAVVDAVDGLFAHCG